MKVKSTRNGNVKITLTPQQARHLGDVLNLSHELDHSPSVSKEAIERTSQELFNGLSGVCQ